MIDRTAWCLLDQTKHGVVRFGIFRATSTAGLAAVRWIISSFLSITQATIVESRCRDVDVPGAIYPTRTAIFNVLLPFYRSGRWDDSCSSDSSAKY